MLVAGERPRSHGTASGGLPLRIQTPRDLKGEIMLSSHFTGVVELDLQRLLILVTFAHTFELTFRSGLEIGPGFGK